MKNLYKRLNAENSKRVARHNVALLSTYTDVDEKRTQCTTPFFDQFYITDSFHGFTVYVTITSDLSSSTYVDSEHRRHNECVK